MQEKLAAIRQGDTTGTCSAYTCTCTTPVAWQIHVHTSRQQQLTSMLHVWHALRSRHMAATTAVTCVTHHALSGLRENSTTRQQQHRPQACHHVGKLAFYTAHGLLHDTLYYRFTPQALRRRHSSKRRAKPHSSCWRARGACSGCAMTHSRVLQQCVWQGMSMRMPGGSEKSMCGR
jgi:hypothetical protein